MRSREYQDAVGLMCILSRMDLLIRIFNCMSSLVSALERQEAMVFKVVLLVLLKRLKEIIMELLAFLWLIFLV